MNFHITTGTYKDERYPFILQVEENGNFHLAPYNDGKDNVTIGVGFNLADDGVRKQVFEKMGITNVDLIKKLVDYLDKPKAKTDAIIQSDLLTIMNQYTPGTTFNFTNENQIKDIFNGPNGNDGLVKTYEDRVDHWATKYGLAAIPESKERLVLLSLAYNGVLGGKLALAINADNRAEAWYEIRYGSNADNLAGLAKRHYYESEIFGLYNDPNNITELEAKQVLQMYTRHQQSITDYEAKYGVDIDGRVEGRNTIAEANNDYSLSGDSQVDTLAEALKPARDVLIDLYVTQKNIDTDINGEVLVGDYSLNLYDHLLGRDETNVPIPQVQPNNDLLIGGLGNDWLEGFSGDDVFYGEDGNDTLDGGDGNDVQYGGEGDDLLKGGKGDDSLLSEGGNDRLYGDVGNDTLLGGKGKDTLEGGKGDDTLNGGQGYDTYIYHTGDGNDTITDEDGLGKLLVDNHLLVARHAKDDPANVYKTTEGDILTLAGSTFTITLHSNGGSVTISNFNRITNDLGIELKDESIAYNGSENNNLFLDALAKLALGVLDFVMSPAYPSTNEMAFIPDATSLRGTNNNDLLIGRSVDYEDSIFGSSGNDTIYADELIEDLTAYVNADSGEIQTLDTIPKNLLSGQSGEDLLVGGVTGDAMLGGSEADLLIGGEGADELYGDQLSSSGAGDQPTDSNDQIYAGAGNDTLWGGGGNDLMFGGSGADYMLGNSGGDDLFGGDGNDFIAGESINETTAGLPYNDYLNGGDGNDSLFGMNGNDQLFGGIGNDLLAGDDGLMAVELQGEDQLYGEDGNDILLGQGYADTLVGGKGNDELYGDGDATPVDIQGDDYLDGGIDDDYLRGYAGNDMLLGGSGRDTLLGEVGDDTLFGEEGDDLMTGGDNNDSLFGEAGNDELQGGEGDDLLEGGVDNDLLFGENGADNLLGDDGNDQLQGNKGNDTLDGGIGDDRLFGQDDNDILIDEIGNNILRGGIGQDNLTSGSGDDRLYGDEGDDQLAAGGGSDTLFGGTGLDTLLGGSGLDTLQGGEDNDLLDGGADNDLLFGEAGADSLYGGNGADRLHGNEDNDLLDGGADNDVLYGETGNDTLQGGDGIDELQGNEGDDQLNGGAGDDRLYGQEGNDLISDEEGDNLLVGGEGSDTLLSGDGDDELYGNAGNDNLNGGNGWDILNGGSGSDILQGGAGGDTYMINLGDGIDRVNDFFEMGYSGISFNNVMVFGQGIYAPDLTLGIGSLLIRLNNNGDAIHIDGFNPDDPYTNPIISRFEFADGTVLSYEQLLSRGFDLTGTPDPDSISGTGADDRIDALASDDVVYGKNGNDTLNGGSGADTLQGGNGNDVYIVDNTNDVLIENNDEGQDSVQSNVTLTLTDNIENLSLSGVMPLMGTGNSLDNELIGNNGDNQLVGLDGNDTLTGNAGYDTLDGGSGSDMLIGGEGDDVYRVDDSNDTLSENADAGLDRVDSSLSFSLAPNIEDLNLIGTALDGTGNELNNSLTGNDSDNRLYGQGSNDILIGNAGNDLLDGGNGIDTLLGGSGDDNYTVDDANDLVTENADDGIDTVYSSVSFGLGINLENLVLLDGQNGFGNELANQITGNGQANWLDGQGGIDTLIGGAGDDSYWLDNAEVQVIEAEDDGYDSVATTVSYSLADHLESLTLIGANALTGIGNGLDNTLYGNMENNTLFGLFGNDLIVDAEGDDQLHGGDGMDSLQGGAGNDWLEGGDGDDSLDGGSGVDVMQGGLGDDTYQVDDSSDVCIEEAGYDTVYAQVDYTLDNAIEDLILTGWQPINGTGNELGNIITGNMSDNVLQGLAGDDRLVGDWGDDSLQGGAGKDLLDGGYGMDVMQGGTDDDTYIVNATADSVIENDGEGRDKVQATTSYTLPDYVENLQLSGDFTQEPYVSPLDGTGNTLDNAIEGNDGVNMLGGLEGQDTIDGRAGDDWLSGDAGDDLLYGGNDAIYLYSGGEGGYEGEGYFYNELASNADVINGQDGNDTVDGGSGDDQLYGSDGDDVLYGGDDGLGIDMPMIESYVFLSNNDALDGGAGHDLMDGGSGNDLLLGGDGEDDLYGGDDGQLNTSNNDFLDGGLGIDTMRGGSGDDAYIVDGTTRLLAVQGFDECHIGSGDDDIGPSLESTADLVIENPNEGYDVIYSSVSLTLPDNVEELDFIGTANVDVVGNADFNVILGNAGNNRIDGGMGADTMAGNQGDDVYFFDSVDDSIIEQADEGVDTVRSRVESYALGANLENLDLVGTAVIGYGNELNNLIRGNALANLIDAGDGNDLITGAGGDDTLLGGMGDDTYVFSIGFGSDVAIDTEGNNDEVRMNDELTINDITLNRQGDDVVLGLKASQDQLVLSNWFNSEQRIEAIRFCDGSVIDSSAIEQAINNQAPVAVDDVVTVREDITVSVTTNLLANDSDPDSADSLSVVNSGYYAASYGIWVLTGNGDVSYILNNAIAEVQSLGEGQHLSETLVYDIQDSHPVQPLNSRAIVTVTIDGINDAPTLEHPVIDQAGRVGEPLSYTLAENSFADIDQGDVLTLSAQLSNGDPLPDWLSFDALSGTFSGIPSLAGNVNISVTATDTGGLIASDVLTLAIAEPKTTSLGDHVWLDSNANGIQDTGEKGIAGVTVKLLAGNGSVQTTTTTDSQGNYLFSQLLPGTYAIHVVAPANYRFTGNNQGNDDTLDSDVDPLTGKTQAITLITGENNLNYDAGLTAQTSSACSIFNFRGNTATDGSDGNIRKFTVDGVSVNASAFSRDKMTGDWSKAWLGSYSGGLGVTDRSEGKGSGNAHTIDNSGRDNYVLFEFSTAVVIDKAYLGYVLNDSDFKVWIGTFNSPFSHHLKLNDTVLSQFGFTELNQTSLNSTRWADVNGQSILGNTLIIAADTTDKSPNDNFKIQQLKVCVPDSDGQKSCKFESEEASGVGTPAFWKQRTASWDGDKDNDKTNSSKTDSLYTVTDPVTGNNTCKGLLMGDWNGNGNTDPSENTLFYSLTEAKAILSTSDSNQDCRYLMGKQLIASWLNVIAGNKVDYIETDINNAIEWLQKHTPNEGGSNKGDGNLTINASMLKIPSTNQDWQVVADPNLVSSGRYCGEAINNVLDYYNATGASFALDHDHGASQGDLITLLGLQAYQQAFHS